MDRRGHRFLLALTSPTEDTDEYSETYVFGGFVAAIAGVLCLIYVVLMCTCKDREHKKAKDIEPQQISQKTDKKLMVQITQTGAEFKSKTVAETEKVSSGPVNASDTLSQDHHLASSLSAHLQSSTRELPVPPVSDHQIQIKSLSGKVPQSTADKSGFTHDGAALVSPQHVQHSHNSSSDNKNDVSSGADGKEKLKSDSHDYDHLGPRHNVKPSDYDSFVKLKSPSEDAPKSGSGEGFDDDYEEVEEKIYPVVIDVTAKKKELFDPYSKVKDKDEIKEEDPYNLIGESDGTVSAALIHQLKLSREQDDPYATVEDDSAADVKSVLDAREAVGGSTLHKGTQASNHFPNSQSTSQDKRDNVEEYAVVQKVKGVMKHTAENDEHSSDDKDVSPYNVSPPEPPRLYNMLGQMDDTIAASKPTNDKRKHKYYKVTARESLASMSARKSTNPYEMVQDLPENTYNMVESEDWSGEGTETLGAVGGIEAERLSQISDTYAEIGISGGGLSSNIISSSNNNTEHNTDRGNPVSSSINTKTQTSSKGDHLSNYQFVSADNAGKSLSSREDIQNSGDSAGSYITLKNDSYLCTVPSGQSTDGASLPDSQTVVHCVFNSKAIDKKEKYPDYDNVDETRAEVAGIRVLQADNNMETNLDSFENKKIGQRRRKLDNI